MPNVNPNEKNFCPDCGSELFVSEVNRKDGDKGGPYDCVLKCKNGHELEGQLKWKRILNG